MTKKEMIYVGMSTAIVGFVLFAYGDFLYTLGKSSGVRWACDEIKKEVVQNA